MEKNSSKVYVWKKGKRRRGTYESGRVCGPMSRRTLCEVISKYEKIVNSGTKRNCSRETVPLRNTDLLWHEADAN